MVLTRKNRESVVVGGSDRFQRILKVTVLEIQCRKVKLGFDLDADVPIHRLEVWERIHGETNVAAPGIKGRGPVDKHIAARSEQRGKSC